MNLNHFLEHPDLHQAAITFASGYAKRMMEGQYDRVMDTKVGQKLSDIARPRKYAIEVALNGIFAYLATKKKNFVKNPVQELIWEVGMNAPSEISKRLLNGYHGKPDSSKLPVAVTNVETSATEEQSAMQGLLQMNPQDLATFLTWLQTATPEERNWMAESMSRLTADEQAKLAALTPDQAKTLFATIAPSPAAPVAPEHKGKNVLNSLTNALRSVNNRLENRANK